MDQATKQPRPGIILIDIRSLLQAFSAMEGMFAVYRVINLCDLLRIIFRFNASMTYKEVIMSHICLALDHAPPEMKPIEINFDKIDANLDIILEGIDSRMREAIGVLDDAENFSFLSWVDPTTVALKHWSIQS